LKILEKGCAKSGNGRKSAPALNGPDWGKGRDQENRDSRRKRLGAGKKAARWKNEGEKLLEKITATSMKQDNG